MRSSKLTVRLDRKTKEQAETVLKHLGLTAPEAVRMFLKQVVIHNGLPFSVRDTRFQDEMGSFYDYDSDENGWDDYQAYRRNDERSGSKDRFYAEVQNFDD